MQGVMGLRMLVRTQVMPRWENDPVWQHDSSNGREFRGGCGYPPPPPGGKWAEGGKGWNGLRRVAYVKINNGSQVWRGHCPRLEHHHLMIWTHPKDRFPGKQQNILCSTKSHFHLHYFYHFFYVKTFTRSWFNLKGCHFYNM